MRLRTADCGHRERVGMIHDGECRECRGVKGEESDHVATTDDPHVAARSRQRIISNASANGGDL